MERPLFGVFVVLNIVLMATAIFIVLKGAAWLGAHPHLAPHSDRIRVLAIAAVLGLPAMTFLRNTRHALILGKSIALSPEQLQQIYAILRRHCDRLGMEQVPDLYFSDMNMKEPALAYTSWKCSYIVLSSKFLQPNLQPVLPVFAFWLGRESGCLRLKHTSWPTEFLLPYVDRIPHLSNPLRRVFAY
jgi:Zn-dependent protease with chaperone function